MLAVKAKIYGVLYKQYSSIAFDETSSYWSSIRCWYMHVTVCKHHRLEKVEGKFVMNNRYSIVTIETSMAAAALLWLSPA